MHYCSSRDEIRSFLNKLFKDRPFPPRYKLRDESTSAHSLQLYSGRAWRSSGWYDNNGWAKVMNSYIIEQCPPLYIDWLAQRASMRFLLIDMISVFFLAWILNLVDAFNDFPSLISANASMGTDDFLYLKKKKNNNLISRICINETKILSSVHSGRYREKCFRQ